MGARTLELALPRTTGYDQGAVLVAEQECHSRCGYRPGWIAEIDDVLRAVEAQPVTPTADRKRLGETAQDLCYHHGAGGGPGLGAT
jgi:hypothetical protein